MAPTVAVGIVKLSLTTVLMSDGNFLAKTLAEI
jgi:hypothetical protein